MKIHSFQDSLKRGKKAESEFYSLLEDKIEQLDGYAADFKVRKNGKLLELKQDTYDPDKTPNFFMERYSYAEQPGGPWQSQTKSIDYYIYWFKQTNDFYVFKVDSLVKKLEELAPTLRTVKVYNTAHVTTGYLVPRNLLTKLNLKLEDIL